jgi:hypothetical protein
MLSECSLTANTISSFQSKINEKLTDYKHLIDQIKSQIPNNEHLFQQAIDEFNTSFFNSMILSLDSCFMNYHIRENPFEEVRLLRDSILNNEAIMCVSSEASYSPVKAILKYKAGDPINLDEKRFKKLAEACFKAVEKDLVQ